MLGDTQPGVFAHWHFDRHFDRHFDWHFDWHFDAELKCHDLHLCAGCHLHDQCG
jgi:hypothetical protein